MKLLVIPAKAGLLADECLTIQRIGVLLFSSPSDKAGSILIQQIKTKATGFPPSRE
ncbi:MAG: hypothetical protein ACMG5Z_08430 [Luteimonas sp.]